MKYIVHSNPDIKTLPCTITTYNTLEKAIDGCVKFWLKINRGETYGHYISPQYVLDYETGEVVMKIERFDTLEHNKQRSSQEA